VNKIPICLIYSRLLAGAIVLALALSAWPHRTSVSVALIIYALVSDIADGIIARRLHISDTRLRRLDSGVDQVFWLLVIGAAMITAPAFFKTNWKPIVLVLALEAVIYATSYLRFGKEVATHSISAKVWTLLLCAMLIQVISIGTSGWLFLCCVITGVLSRLEILAILLLLKKWENDVPSVYHAIQLRRGSAIKRSKWFNG